MANTQGGATLRAVDLVVESYRILGANWRDCMLALAIPALIDTLVGIALIRRVEAIQQQVLTSEEFLDRLSSEENLVRLLATLLVSIITMTLFAVAWHRMCLLRERPSQLPRVGPEHVRFVVLSITLMFMTFIAGVSSIVFVIFVMGLLNLSAVVGLQVVLLFLPAILAVVMYVKLSMMFPAAALNKRCSVFQSWTITRGATLTIFWAVVMGAVPAWIALAILGAVVSSVIGAIFQGAELGTWIYLAFQAVLSYLPWAIVIGIVSLAYRRLAGQAHPDPQRGNHGA